VQVKFTLTELGDTFLDYAGESLAWVKVNGKEVTDNPFANDKINLKAELLVLGENVVDIRFESRYVRDCEGIHYYRDNADGEEYLYSQFEAASAHKAFPCFD
jgi:aminopeptidase N